jgi:hypothetical protein
LLAAFAGVFGGGAFEVGSLFERLYGQKLNSALPLGKKAEGAFIGRGCFPDLEGAPFSFR